MKQKILKFILALLLFIPLMTPAFADEEIELYLNSESVVLMDAVTKRVLYNQNGDLKTAPASLTKIMTMLLACERGHLRQELKASSEAINSIDYGSSHINLVEDEIITLEDAIKACSIESANDAANVIAENLSGSIAQFTQEMNQRAKLIGCNDTSFTTAHGLDEEDQYTTAIDLAKIYSEAIANPTFLKLTAIQQTALEPTNKTVEKRTLYSENRCMDKEDEYYIPDVVCAKSGYTDEAGNCFAAYFQNNNRHFIAIFMNAENGSDYYEDLMTLYHFSMDQFVAFEDVNKLATKKKAKLNIFALGGEIALEKPFNAPLCKSGEENCFKVVYDIDNQKVKKGNVGDTIGTASLFYEGELVQFRDVKLTSARQTFLSLILKFLLFIMIWLIASLAILFSMEACRKAAKRKKLREQSKKMAAKIAAINPEDTFEE